MTNAQSYTLKEMLDKMEKRSISDRQETNTKIDNVYSMLSDHIIEGRNIDKAQDDRIDRLEIWQGGKLAVGRWAAAIGSIVGAGMVTVILWLIFGEKID